MNCIVILTTKRGNLTVDETEAKYALKAAAPDWMTDELRAQAMLAFSFMPAEAMRIGHDGSVENLHEVLEYLLFINSIHVVDGVMKVRKEIIDELNKIVLSSQVGVVND